MPDAANSSAAPSRPSIGAPVRAALGAAVLVAAGALGGCPQAPRQTVTRPMQPDLRNMTAPILGEEPVAGGIYMSLGSYTPLSGAALTRALSRRSDIRKAIIASIPPATTQRAAKPESDIDPPPLAVKYYLEGREKFLDGANTEAMEFLEKALQLDPNAFTVLRLMGRVCFASSELARGVLYLQKAEQQRPADVEVNYLLGRYWLERKDYNRAVFYLLQGDDSPEHDATSPQTPLVTFYLARALQADGYHREAASEYEQFLAMVAVPVPAFRYDRELNYLIEESWATHLSVAENDVLIGKYAAAIPHYTEAAADQPDDAFIASRLVNAEIHAGQNEKARESALALVSATKGSNPSLQLLAWVYRAEHREDALIPDLRGRLAGSSDDVTALTIAAALDYLGRSDEAFQTVLTYEQAHPGNLDVLGRLIKRVTTADQFGKAIEAAAAAITAEPAKAEEIVELLRPITQSPAARGYTASLGSAKGAALSPATEPAARYLIAVTEEDQDAAPAEIDRQFQQTLHLKPDFQEAREAYVSWLLSQEQYAKASTLIREAIDSNHGGAKAWLLLVDADTAQEQYLNALHVAEEAKRKFPDNPDVRLKLANIEAERGDLDKADAELQQANEDFPKYEPAYIALINLRISRMDTTGQDMNGRDFTNVAGVVAKLLREIPNSKFGQITTATFYARAGRYEDADALLRRLLAENPDDPEILGPLAEVRALMGRMGDAVAMLQQSLKEHPQLEIARDLVALYTQQGKSQDAIELARRLATENPTSEGFALLLSATQQADRQSDQAIQTLTAAVDKFPRSQKVAFALARLQERANKPEEAVATWKAFMQRAGETPDRLYLLSNFYNSAGNHDAVVATLQKVLSMQPDHTGANNDLGYFWADEGIHLDQAERMIRKALENEPNKSAFVDSLGWLYYKQGKFKAAASTLEKAIALPEGMEAEVAQHLGDALYRAGQKSEAMDRWTQAEALLSLERPPLPKDVQRVKEYLDRVTSAARAGQEPPLSPIATEPKSQSAGPTTLPKPNSD